jgi:protein O-GlcNAcase/histone acetyltransferase
LANALADELDISIWVTPRVYADELIISDIAYLPEFLETLEESHIVLYCGSDVVSKHASVRSLQTLCNAQSQCRTRQTVLWDNLYANDYCPRRLFVGPWQGRAGISNVLLNPTGMIHTDSLLLDLMAAHNGLVDNSIEAIDAWRTVLIRHGVPDSFFELAPYFYHPVFNSHKDPSLPIATSATFDAIEHCLWRWKKPLAREWYAYIFGLKHDLLAEQNRLSEDRIRKTQTAPLAQTLLRLR